MARVQRPQREETVPQSRRAQDIVGILLFFAGAASLLSLAWDQSAPIPSFVDTTLRYIAGSGAYAIPILLLFAGTMFLIGYEELSVSHSSFGTVLGFLTFETWQHIARVHPVGGWDSEETRRAGGLVGGLLGAGLAKVFGTPIAYMFLVAMGLVAVVLLVDQPLVEVFRRISDRGKAGVQAAGRTLNIGSKNGSATDRRGSAGRGTDLAAAPKETGRTKRPLITGLTDLDDEVADEPVPSTNRLLNLFNITRSWSDESPEEETQPAPPVKSRRAASASQANADEGKPADARVDAASPGPSDVEANRHSDPGDFALPPLNLLTEAPIATARRSQAELTERSQILEQTLDQFNIGASVVEVASGPSVTRYEIQLAPGIKVSKIVSLADNLAMSLAAIDVRVEAPIPGKSAIGVEVPNSTPVTVGLRECLDTAEFRDAASPLTIALGKDVAGQYKYADLTRMPHLLIGGSTNSGKSVCLNALIASLVYRNTPDRIKLLMIDPKRVELSLWDGIPHLMHPVVKDVKQAAGVFRAALREMDRRYDLFSNVGTRNIEGYNQKVSMAESLPYLVLIVDELADLMMQQGPEIETSICRLAQLARATGIHLVIATQRPSVDIITGTIKANISSRIAFAVASQVDSRTILDMPGADRLIGRGDMLFMPIDVSKPVRIQGCYMSEAETNALVAYLKAQQKPEYGLTVTEVSGGSSSAGAPSDDDDDDQFFEQAVRMVVNNGQASTSMLQRRFRIGYTRAARIVEMMEERGIVGSLNGAKPREILVSKDEVERMFNPGFLPGVDDYVDEG